MEPGTSKPCHQKRMGPAPFASFEDLSDEMDSPGEKEVSVIRLPGITEQDVSGISPDVDTKTRHHTGVSLIGSTLRSSHSSSPNSLSHSPIPNKMKLANTPRIDISRASSSSHHDSRDSTPEREMFESTDPNNVKLGLGFKEDDALELRLSTEELDFQDVTETKSHKYKHRSASPAFDELYTSSNRKDSQCSDVVLLSISGRTSRLSSIGSQGSARSRLSNASHISVTSGQSAYSQCSSPHKTLLETSFCGYRSSHSNIALEHTDSREDSDDFEKVLLSRKSNPTEAVLVEGLCHKIQVKPSDEARVSIKQHKEQKIRTREDKSADEKPKLPRRIISKSGVEYIYIPLKGPLPPDDSEDKPCSTKVVERSTTSSNGATRRRTDKNREKTRHHPPPCSNMDTSPIQNQEPKYIRIKLKPDHCYDENDRGTPTSTVPKPEGLSLPLHRENGTTTLTTKVHGDNNFNSIQKHARSLTNSPKLLKKEMGGLSPTPSVARRNSFATLFRTGPDSPGTAKQKRKNTLIGCYPSSHSKSGSKSSGTCVSSTESVDSKGKHKSLLSLFKLKDKAKASADVVQEKAHNATPVGSKPKHHRDERKELPLNSESIRIPLHSPTYYENKSLLQELQASSQDSQVTVVEVVPQNKSNSTVTPISEEPKSKLQCTQCTVEVVETSVKEEVLDTCLQTCAEAPPNSSETSKIITTTAEIELANIPPCQIVKETETTATVSALENLDDKPLIIESQSNSGSHAFDDHNSSESERDIELLEYRKCDKPLLPSTESTEIERKAIVLQQDSFEDELPYVPTTLPQERSAAVPILPIKQRCVLDRKTCPIERPRSTTPIHSSGLETYFDGFAVVYEAASSEKLKISLPRVDLPAKPKTQAETATSTSKPKDETPPPLPPKGIQKSWINFEEVPERRKPPKRIQTIPSRGQIDISGLIKDNVVYTYVNPEECKCECHEHKEPENRTVTPQIQEDEVPLLNQEEKGVELHR